MSKQTGSKPNYGVTFQPLGIDSPYGEIRIKSHELAYTEVMRSLDGIMATDLVEAFHGCMLALGYAREGILSAYEQKLDEEDYWKDK